jgi:hypothetical protein
MRLTRFGLLLTLLVTLTGGPLLAAPLSLTAGAHLTDPHRAGRASGLVTVLAWGAGIVAFGITIKRDTAAIVNKYVTRASAAQGDYKTGVSNAGGVWEQHAGAAEGNWEQGTTDAIGRKAFQKGVTGKGGKYQNNAVNLGAQRYPQGVQNASGAYQTGMQPVLDKLKSINLPPKGPRRSPQNQARANMVATELGKLKTGK